MIILGINAYHGDVSAALVRDGELVAAVEEERLRRIKHCAGFPRLAIRSCLEIAGITAEEVDHFAIARNPRAHVLRKALFALRQRPGARIVRDRLQNRRRVADVWEPITELLRLRPERVRARLHWVEHHPAHLASALDVSPFEEAAVCAVDAFGDFVSTSLAVGRGRELRVLDHVYFPHSLGLLYLAITQFLGFPAYGDEYKVMGLASFGEPDQAGTLGRLLRLGSGGKFALDLSYFRHWSEGVTMTWDDGAPTIGSVFTPKLEQLLGPARRPDEPLTDRHHAIAASLQRVFEDAVMHVLNELHHRTGLPRLCLAGGCALNGVANGKIRQRTPFAEISIQPAAADNGTALGAAFHVWHRALNQPRRFVMEHSYWGPAATEAEIRAALEHSGRELERLGCRERRFVDEDELCRWTVGRLAEGRIVGWFQGRMEWGARALGNRSILADPRRLDMRDIMNRQIKVREAFRPFAPSLLEEHLDEFFVGAARDPFMTQVYPVRQDKRTVIPAVTHVDGTGRPQCVSRRANPLFWRLLTAFGELTGVPVLLNTSFNENEPIVLRPSEALDCFLRTKLDVLVMGRTAVDRLGAPPRSAAQP